MDDDKEFHHQEPPRAYFVFAFILGAATSYGLATYWFALSSPVIAIVLGSLFSLLGFELGENIGEAIVFTVIISLLVFVFHQVGPDIGILKSSIVPIATGFCSGKLFYGLWVETLSR